TLLLQVEQGLGDTIHFARYASVLAARGARCIIRCPRALAPLLATVPGVAGIALESEPLPPYDYYVPIVSIPRIVGTTPQTIPHTVPYLSVEEDRRLEARTTLATTGTKRRIGLCWAGSPANANDRNRSMALTLFAPLLDLEGIAWFSLQAGEAV